MAQQQHDSRLFVGSPESNSFLQSPSLMSYRGQIVVVKKSVMRHSEHFLKARTRFQKIDCEKDGPYLVERKT